MNYQARQAKLANQAGQPSQREPTMISEDHRGATLIKTPENM